MQRHSILGELGWLAFFIVVLVVAVYGMNLLVDALFPHHFNDKVADAIAALFAAAVFIATRSALSRRGSH